MVLETPLCCAQFPVPCELISRSNRGVATNSQGLDIAGPRKVPKELSIDFPSLNNTMGRRLLNNLFCMVLVVVEM